VETDVVDEVGAASGLEALFRAHHAGLLRLGMVLTGDPALAEELAQEAFVRLHRSPTPPRPGAELAYLRRTLVNLSHGHHRHLAVVRRAPVEVPDDARSAEDVVGDEHRRGRIAAAVRALPARQRDCVVLHYFDELSDVEVADTLGISAGSVKTHLHRARAALAAQLGGER
jgi:RNA polymerase sigma-70 factor (sigma-E family)